MKRLLAIFRHESACSRLAPCLAAVGRVLLGVTVAFGVVAGLMEHFHPTSVSAHLSFAALAVLLTAAVALAALETPRRERALSRWLVAMPLAFAFALDAWLIFAPTPNLQPALAVATGLVVLAAPLALSTLDS